jgi:GYF domain 2
MNPSWYIVSGGKAVGPVDLAAMKHMFAQGQLKSDTQVCLVGASAWITASNDQLLAGIFASARHKEAPPIHSQRPHSPALSINTSTFSFGGAFTRTIDTIKKAWIVLFLTGLIWGFILIVLQIPSSVLNLLVTFGSDNSNELMLLYVIMSYVFSFVAFLISAPLNAGLFFVGAQASLGLAKVLDIFQGYKHRVGLVFMVSVSYTAAAIVGSVLGIIIPVFLGVFGGGLIRNGKLVFGIPLLVLALGIFAVGMYFLILYSIRFYLAPVVACDPSLGSPGFVECFKISFKATKGREGPILGFLIIIAVLAGLSILLLGVGFIIIGIPLLIAGFGAVYHLCCREQQRMV